MSPRRLLTTVGCALAWATVAFLFCLCLSLGMERFGATPRGGLTFFVTYCVFWFCLGWGFNEKKE